MSLETCDDEHEPIVYESSGSRSKCPVCELIKEHTEKTEEYAQEIAKLQGQVNDLEEANTELETKLEEANAWAKERFNTSTDPKRVVPKPKGEL